MESFIDGIMATLIYLAAAFVLFIVGKIVFQLFNPKIKVAWELVENDNLAFAVAYVGYFTGLLLAIGSALMGESHGLIIDLMDIGVYGLLAIVLLNISIIINDKLILSKFDVKKEILQDKNVGTGVIQGANGVATGLIILGAIHGDGFGAGGPVVTAVAYWVLGQILLLVTAKVYNAITPYDVHEHIEKDNYAVALGFAGAIISIGNLIRFALMHDFDSWIVTLQDVALDVSIGLIFLPIVRLFTDKVLLPGQNLTDELINQEKPNLGAAFIEGFAYIGGSVLITWSL